MALVIGNYFKTVLIWKIFNPNYDFLVPLCLYLVQKYKKNAVANGFLQLESTIDENENVFIHVCIK
jgi:hypothetical protein